MAVVSCSTVRKPRNVKNAATRRSGVEVISSAICRLPSRSERKPTAAGDQESPRRWARKRLIVTALARRLGGTTFCPIAVKGPL